MNYILIYFPDGTFMIMTSGAEKLPPRAKDFKTGTKFFEVSDDLTVADISEIYSGNGFAREVYPARLEKLIRLITPR